MAATVFIQLHIFLYRQVFVTQWFNSFYFKWICGKQPRFPTESWSHIFQQLRTSFFTVSSLYPRPPHDDRRLYFDSMNPFLRDTRLQECLLLWPALSLRYPSPFHGTSGSGFTEYVDEVPWLIGLSVDHNLISIAVRQEGGRLGGIGNRSSSSPSFVLEALQHTLRHLQQ